MKIVQFFDDDYLEQCRNLTTEEIVEYLENFRLLLQPAKDKSIAISVRVPVTLLANFKTKAALKQVKYQTQIKKLMQDWVLEK